MNTEGLTVEQLRTMDGDGSVRRVEPVSEPVGFYGQHPLRNDDISITEANAIPAPDRRPWWQKDDNAGVL